MKNEQNDKLFGLLKYRFPEKKFGKPCSLDYQIDLQDR